MTHPSRRPAASRAPAHIRPPSQTSARTRCCSCGSRCWGQGREGEGGRAGTAPRPGFSNASGFSNPRRRRSAAPAGGQKRLFLRASPPSCHPFNAFMSYLLLMSSVSSHQLNSSTNTRPRAAAAKKFQPHIANSSKSNKINKIKTKCFSSIRQPMPAALTQSL